MFRTEKIKVYLQNVGWKGKEDAPLNQLTFYITPITYDLASEISPEIAKAMFSKSIDNRQNPMAVLASTRFKTPKFQLQAVKFHPSMDPEVDNLGVLTEGWNIKALWAMHLFADSDDLTLAFLMEAPLDKLTIELAQKYYKRQLYLTMTSMQTELFETTTAAIPATALKCIECNEPAEWIDQNKDTWCGPHVRGAFGETRKINKDAALEPLKEKDKEDMSHANRRRGSRKGKK
jgi:hypothetical protein